MGAALSQETKTVALSSFSDPNLASESDAIIMSLHTYMKSGASGVNQAFGDFQERATSALRKIELNVSAPRLTAGEIYACLEALASTSGMLGKLGSPGVNYDLAFNGAIKSLATAL